MVHIGNDWDALLKDEFRKEYYLRLRQFLAYEYRHAVVYPDMYDIFNALKYTPYEKVKVVLLGQDPYHGRGQAHGLCFSVQKGVTPPPSLQNIYQELHRDIGFQIPAHGNLSAWARQGVLMLNTVLTVRANQPNSHANKGWEQLTDRIIQLLDQKDAPLVFLLWGKNARSKQALLSNPRHQILTTSHPSPYSVHYGFAGCGHFSKTNAFLTANGCTPIDWQLPMTL